MTELKEGVIRVKDLNRILKNCKPEDLVGFSYPHYVGWDGKTSTLELATNISIDFLEFDGEDKTIIVLEI